MKGVCFNMYEPNYSPNAELNVSASNGLSSHIAKTYAWMFLGLLLTFSTAVTLIQTGLVVLLFTSTFAVFAPLILQLVLVVVLSAKLQSMSIGMARVLFVVYSLVMGVSFSTILMAYGYEQAILVFGLACGFFGIMAIAGHITKRDVSRFRPLVIGGLVTLLVLSLINMFMHIEAFDLMICFFGLILFMGITTYDAKKTKDWYYAYQGDEEMLAKASIYSALNLYLDFLNIFLYLLRLLNRNR